MEGIVLRKQRTEDKVIYWCNKYGLKWHKLSTNHIRVWDDVITLDVFKSKFHCITTQGRGSFQDVQNLLQFFFNVKRKGVTT